MLVLTRKQNEKIRIGSSIVITVVRTKGKAVRLGIEAPSDVNILRGELAFENSADASESRQEKAGAAAVNRSPDQPLRGKKTRPNTASSPRNPGGPWSGNRADEQTPSVSQAGLDAGLAGPTWPAALTDAIR